MIGYTKDAQFFFLFVIINRRYFLKKTTIVLALPFTFLLLKKSDISFRSIRFTTVRGTENYDN